MKPRHGCVGLALFLMLGGACRRQTHRGSPEGPELRPISLYHDLVAGQGCAGYRDGAFFEAQFSGPVGLARDSQRNLLFVADRDSNRLRSIDLDADNRVATVAGSGHPGQADGSLESASFDHPTAIVSIAPGVLIVNDDGNALFRRVDLTSRRVTTIAGNGSRGVAEGDSSAVPLGHVWGLAFRPTEKALYFTQPLFGAVRRLDLTSRKVTTVLKDDPRIPSPGALTTFGNELWIADRVGAVFKFALPVPDLETASSTLQDAGPGHQVLALAASANRVYALQGDQDKPWVVVWPPDAAALVSVSGNPLETLAATQLAFLNFGPDQPVGFVADPRRETAFFVSSSSLQQILDVKDYRFVPLRDSQTLNDEGLYDFNYPVRKAKGVFRILLVGDSHLFYGTQAEVQRWGWGTNRMEVFPKRLELMLNTAAALRELPARYEVLTLARVSWEPLAVWPAYFAPQVAQRFDADLVLMMIPPDTATLQAYVDRPAAPDGIPVGAVDSEYMLEPYREKIQKSPARKILEQCEAHGWIHVASPSGIEIDRLRVLVTDPEIREEMLRLFARPIHKLQANLREVRGTHPPHLILCFLPAAARDSDESERSFWKQLCAREGVTWMDPTDAYLALQSTYFPVSDGFHLTANGHELMAFLVTHELSREGAILTPFQN